MSTGIIELHIVNGKTPVAIQARHITTFISSVDGTIITILGRDCDGEIEVVETYDEVMSAVLGVLP